jgi:acyl carrier protein
MVPTVYVIRQSFPLTTSGKIDRQKLKIPEKMRVGKEETYVAPRTQTEHTLLRTWQEVLGIAKIGMNDNFFELGGNSLLLIRAYSKLKALFGEKISVADLLTYPTLATLADFLTEAQPEPAARDSTLSHAQQRKARMEQQRAARERFRHQR